MTENVIKSSALSKFLIASLGLLVITTGYLYWQQVALANQLADNRTHCAQRITSLLENMERAAFAPAALKTVKNITHTTSTQTAPAIDAEPLTYTTRLADQPQLQKYSETLEDIVKRKYRFLLSRLNLSEADKEELLQLLIRREEIHLQIRDAEDYADEVAIDAAELTDLRYELEEIDEQIQLLLGDAAERFVLLRNSDKEQKEFSQYTLGVTGLFPLSGKQQEAVLLARLQHKQKFESEIEASGFHLDYPLTAEQQQEIMQKIEKAAYRYKEAYLTAVRPHLEHDNFPMDQYTLLENYTRTEFETLVADMREKLESRGQIGN